MAAFLTGLARCAGVQATFSSACPKRNVVVAVARRVFTKPTKTIGIEARLACLKARVASLNRRITELERVVGIKAQTSDGKHRHVRATVYAPDFAPYIPEDEAQCGV